MANFSDLLTILDYRGLTELYQDFARQNAGPNPFWDFYTAGVPEKMKTDDVEFIKLSAVKDPAPINYRGQPARVLQPTGKDKRRLAMLGAFNEISLGFSVLQMMRHPEQWALQDRGREEIKQQIEDFASRHAVTKRVYLAKSLLTATIYIDANGDICESNPSSGHTISTGIPSGNLTTIGGIIDKLWSDRTAKILDHLDTIAVAAEDANTEPPRHVWFNTFNKKYLRSNDQILEQYDMGRERLDNALRGDTLEINNYTFHFYGGSYTNTSGSNAYYIPRDQVIITPDPGSWYKQGEGLQLVPETFDPTTSLEGITDGWTDNYGDFAYALRNHNPPSARLYMGFNWLWGLRNPSSVYAPTVFSGV